MSNNPVIVAQALISGRVLDQVQNLPVSRGLTLSLWYRPAPEGDAEAGEYLPASFYKKVTSDGYFCFSASGGSVFGDRSPMPDMQFRLDIKAPGYQPLSHDFELASGRLVSTESDLELAGQSREVTRITGPFDDLTLELSPTPLRLTGQILRDGDPEAPLANAEVTVSAPETRPAVTTDERGFFAIDNLPLAREITLTLSDGSDDQSQTVRLDYRQPVNNRRFIFR
ncbi:hypothetical protein QPM17_20550 [Marinobacter sp. TBZ242]|uniref:Carboxypeptidase regulatory-like domain-containing protein n=1 Tax=Marinobacter azerbaijanicus TaxID=3050455 RepID=A0ABT7IHA2_9GAMM|nr:hypothetical protein [Marinobacter sp. TBZ242]MDL0433539.1 hypothetical protein [Marinobacter sp. TBZ242]